MHHARSFNISRRPLAVLVPLVFPLVLSSAGAYAAQPLPTGGAFVAGAGTISSGAQSVTVGQSSARGVITWNSFDIGAGKTVNINNGNGATLNRVTGGSASSILGSLNATGSVYLVNPQGVVIGTSGVVTTGGRFVASALDVTNAAFMSGGALTFASAANGGNGAVVNLGKIGSSGGDVFLIARSKVSNEGTISAPKGTVEMATGSQVLVQDSTSGQQVFVNAGSGGTVSNSGAIDAAQVNLQAADGNVFALAGNHSAIRATGTATRDGHVWLVADKGHVQIHNDVSAANADGSGGTVDSSGTTLNIGNSVVSAGQWNFTVPVSYTIDQITASALSASLNKGTSIDMEAKGSSSGFALNGGIGWNSGASLTLGAGRNVGITKSGSISNTSSGDLTLRADAGSIDNGGSVVNLGKVDWSKSTGLVSALYDMNGAYTPGTMLANQQWSADQYSGYVTQITGYRLVNNATDLQNISKNLAANYALGKDVSIGTVTTPIGTDETTPYTGQFDGFGHAISDLRVSGDFYNGLFAVIGQSGVVRNVSVSGSVGGGGPGIFGMLAAENLGVIAYASSSGTVGNGYYGGSNGGLVARNYGTIERSSSSANAVYQGSSGGLVASNFGTIVQSFSTGGASGASRGAAGGLASDNEGLISQSYSTGAAGSNFDAGSLVATNGANGVIDQSFAVGAVVIGQPSAGGQTGGIAAFNDGAIHSNVYWDKTTTQQSAAADVNTGSVPPASNGLTTAQMSNASSFAGWDFSAGGVWAMPAGATHPILQWQQANQ
jgi:filamentous hemagglutinin family protein